MTRYTADELDAMFQGIHARNQAHLRNAAEMGLESFQGGDA